MRNLSILLFFVPLCANAATLRGRVVDALTAEPVARARVVLAGTAHATVTDQEGVFTLDGVPEGDVELRVTTVGYGLFKKRIQLPGVQQIDIALHQDGAARTDTITVAAGAFDLPDLTAPSEKTLQKSEIENLSMVLLGDPLRAAQALPGVATNNDLRAEFSVRGASYNRVGIYVDGVLVDDFVHSASLGINGSASNEKLSISIIDSNTVAEMTLNSGAYPSNYGDSSAAILGIETREGNFVRTSGRFVTGVLGASGVVDRPFAKKKASWLVAGRSSYADYLERFVQYITRTGRNAAEHSEPETSLDFSDGQAKLVYNPTSRQQVGISTTYGTFNADDHQEPGGTSALERLNRYDSSNLLINTHWRYTAGPAFLLSARVFAQRNETTDWNRNGVVLDDSAVHQEGFRADATWWWRPTQKLDAGMYFRHIGKRKLTNGLIPTPLVLERYDETASEPSFYSQNTWKRERLALTLGGRIDHSGITGETLVSPRGSFTWSPFNGWNLRGGAGLYAQFPDLDQVFGYFGNRDLRAERAAHYNLSIERLLGNRARILVEAYDREDRNQIFAFVDPRLLDGKVVANAAPWRNMLRGHARGVEITVQRRSANRLSGWLSYGYLSTRYYDKADNLQWPGDFDQRHTLNVFGTYRLKPTVNFSAQWRYGSGMPWPGFIQQTAPNNYALGPDRNRIRLPDYRRLDLRVNKAFVFSRLKLTLAGEVLNVLDHDNYFIQSTDPLRFQRSGQFSSGHDQGIPIAPAISITVGF